MRMLASLLCYGGLTLAHVLAIGAYRVTCTLLGAKANSFLATKPHGPEWYQRLCRAHMNCVENLPIFATLVLVAAVLGINDSNLDLFASLVVFARIGHSLPISHPAAFWL